MELLQDFFPTLKVKEAVYTRVEATAPWGFQFIPYRHTKFGIVTHGSCYIDLLDGEPPIRLERGSCYLLTRGDAFRLRDQPSSATIDFEEALRYLDGRLLRYGGGGDAATIVGGRFIFTHGSYPPVLDLLPPLIHFKVNAAELKAIEATIELLANETTSPSLGSALMVDRVADIFFIQSLRAYWLSEQQGDVEWLGAAADKRLSMALALMHKEPHRPWTLEELAGHAGMSRSVFATRFKEKINISPMAYLTRYRLYHAEQLLQQSTLTIAQIAEQIGYASEAAFNKAFRRKQGVPPGEFRRSSAISPMESGNSRYNEP